ncbi:MAG: NAD-dependent deacylase [Acidimicrobiia bacterium]|nr:NAD-dependent deacylase [Acidimicrobiia bacterium]
MGIDQDAVGRIAALISAAQRIVVLTGAGMSTESGIPDFRGPQGIWTKDPDAEKMADIRYYLADADIRGRAWRHRLESGMWSAEPNAGHRALAELERRGDLHTLITQNVDGLHQAAGNAPERVVEIHGTVHEVKCMGCGARSPMAPTLARVEAGEDDPACEACGGILKSATISFGENLVPEDLRRSQDAAASADLFLALGSSLTVYPAAALPELAVGAGAALVVINAEHTPFDPLADVVARDSLGDVLTAVVQAL